MEFDVAKFPLTVSCLHLSLNLSKSASILSSSASASPFPHLPASQTARQPSQLNWRLSCCAQPASYAPQICLLLSFEMYHGTAW